MIQLNVVDIILSYMKINQFHRFHQQIRFFFGFNFLNILFWIISVNRGDLCYHGALLFLLQIENKHLI